MPIEHEQFYSLLGIAMRAGALTFGQDGVLKAISSGAAGFVLLDSSASDNTKKKISDSCRYYGVEVKERFPPRGKDYNDYLCDLLGLQRTTRKAKENTTNERV